MTFKEFFIDKYKSHEEALRRCFETLRKDLPLPGWRFGFLHETLRSLEAFGKLFRSEPERPLRRLFFKNEGWPEFTTGIAPYADGQGRRHSPDWPSGQAYADGPRRHRAVGNISVGVARMTVGIEKPSA